MFGKLFKKPQPGLVVGGHPVDVLSILRDGRILHTSDTVRTFSKTHLEGQIFEVLFGTRSGLPYFAYYLCPPYYLAAVGPAGANAFGGHHRTEQFRMGVSQAIAKFIAETVRAKFGVEVASDISNFSHNKAHTNVLTYVSSLDGWFPIQHHDGEDENAAERKVSFVNSGVAPIQDFLARDSLSPFSLR